MIRALLYKDFLRRWRNPGGFIMLMLIPIAFALLFGSLFGPGRQKNLMPRVHLLIEDHDNSFASQFVASAFGRGELAKMFQVENINKNQGRPLMDKAKASALLIIPDGFGDSLLSRQPANLLLIKNPSQSFAPKIVEETVDILAEGGDRLLYIAAKPLQAINQGVKNPDLADELMVAQVAVQIRKLFVKGGDRLFPPAITITEIKTAAKEDSSDADSAVLFASMLVGMGIMTLLFALDTFARDFFRERDNHTLYRIHVAPASIIDYVSAKLLFIFLAGLLSQILMWLVGMVFFSIRLQQPIFFLLLLILAVATCTGIIALIYGFSTTRNQAAAILPAVIIVLCMLAGCMLPLNLLPSAISSLARFSPVYWCTTGLQKLLTEPNDPGALFPHLLILFSLTVLMNGLAFVLFYRKVRV